jgi:uncharacterized protein YjbJ (UPF0337 family)
MCMRRKSGYFYVKALLATGRSGNVAATEGALMNDKIENKGEELKGKAKETVGDATGNEQWQAEGKSDQAKGSLKQAGEKVKDAVKGVTNKD